MDFEEEKLMKKWVQHWQAVAPELEKIKREEIRHTNTQRAIENLDDAFMAAILNSPPRLSSGLVEQQRLFQRFKT